MVPEDKKYRLRKPNKNESYASGSLFAVNTMFDLGVDVNRYLLALTGLVTEETDATSYLSFDADYSLGFNVMGGQRFDDPTVALARLERESELNQYNDGRLSKNGYVGGWFLACDMGNLSFKTQGYRYRHTPLANGLMMSMAYWINGRSLITRK